MKIITIVKGVVVQLDYDDLITIRKALNLAKSKAINPEYEESMISTSKTIIDEILDAL